jgi:CubicO group peptidase (beta-lactamase class C family)
MHGGRSLAVFAATAVLVLLLTACSGGSEQASEGLDAAQLVHDVEQDLSGDPEHDALRALIVQVHGKAVVEQYFAGASSDSYWETASVTKSFLSTLVGIAIADGKISGVEATLAELLPSHARQMTPRVARTRLRDVLTMTGGFPGTEADLLADVSSPDPVGSILRGSRGAPGGFVYSDEGAHIVAAILAEATGSTVLEYARDRLFAPLGIKSEPAFEARITPTGPIAERLAAKYVAADFAWPTDSGGTHTGWGLIKLRPLDLVKLGQLFLDHGRWRGKQVVPASWVRDATSAQVQGAAGSYGYEWWVTEADGEPAYQALGFGGQLIEVVPDRDLVVVMATELDPARTSGSGLSPQVLGQVVNDTIAPAVPR